MRGIYKDMISTAKYESSFGKLSVIVVILFAVFLPFSAIALDLPSPSGFVNDFAGLLKAEERAALEQTLKDFERQTSNEVVLTIVSSFQGMDRFSYSQELFTQWGIGQKDRNNGVLFIIGPKEGFPFPKRGEAFINVGSGLEGALTDSISGAILRNEVFPDFKNNNYYAGIQKGINAIMQATKGEYEAATEDFSVNGDFLGFLFWFGFLFLTYLTSFLARSKSWWAGGVIGGIIGVILGVVFWAGIFILVSGFVSGGVGLIFDYIVSKNYEARKRAGKPTDFWHSGGGFWFGGGGFGRGGGFGGFGGGRSGGGGAGGGW